MTHGAREGIQSVVVLQALLLLGNLLELMEQGVRTAMTSSVPLGQPIVLLYHLLADNQPTTSDDRFKDADHAQFLVTALEWFGD